MNAKQHKSIRQRILDQMNKTPLWMEFTLVLTVILLLLINLLVYSFYFRDRSIIINGRYADAERVLDLKMKSLEKYLEDLSSFSVQLVYDTKLYSAMTSDAPLSDSDMENLRSAIKSSYYSRSDLLTYHVQIPSKDLSVGKDAGREGFRSTVTEGITQSEAYRLCSANPKGFAILPSDLEDGLFHYYHSLIRVEDRSVMALLDFDAKKSALDIINASSITPHEVICLYSPENVLLYPKEDPGIQEADYLKTTVQGESGLTLVSYLPTSEIMAHLQTTKNFATAAGLIFLIVAVVLVIILIRFLSAPLTALAVMQDQYAGGYLEDQQLGRSKESAELGKSFHRMINQIDRLLERNNDTEEKERTARLKALEAQLNPTFIYTVLAEISEEALKQDQPEIRDMLVTLAGNLRYTISAANVVTLREELQYMNNYVKLQKLRLKERIQISQIANDAAMNLYVPKISIQQLVENSINHGLRGDDNTIHIVIDVTVKENKSLLIRVRDDGRGIPEDKLQEFRLSFHKQAHYSTDEDPASLTNLYNRIRLIYNEGAAMMIDSRTGENSYTEVSLLLPHADKIKHR
ncbi:MAG: histidine kinase [Lachnospiraceae bacterium]|nr:histidine kinase [Lachnospiraceae bacterium]